jgi:hypothetical protein
VENNVTVRSKTNILHNGKSYREGDSIVMAEAEAEKLLKVGAVEMSASVISAIDKIAELDAVIKGVREELQNAKGQLSIATGQIDDLLAENKKLKDEQKQDAVPAKKAKS